MDLLTQIALAIWGIWILCLLHAILVQLRKANAAIEKASRYVAVYDAHLTAIDQNTARR